MAPCAATSAARCGEGLVHGAVAVPAVGVVHRGSDRVVVERPQRAVRDAVVVARDLLGPEADRLEREPSCSNDSVGSSTAPVHPTHTPWCSRSRPDECAHQAARAVAPAVVGVLHRQSIGHDHEVVQPSCAADPPAGRSARLGAGLGERVDVDGSWDMVLASASPPGAGAPSSMMTAVVELCVRVEVPVTMTRRVPLRASLTREIASRSCAVSRPPSRRPLRPAPTRWPCSRDACAARPARCGRRRR